MLPPEADPLVWESPLALGEFTPAASLPDSGGVEIRSLGTSWELRAVVGETTRTVVVAIPATASQREDLALLARSLLSPSPDSPLAVPRSPRPLLAWAEIGGGASLPASAGAAPLGTIVVGARLAPWHLGARVAAAPISALPALGEDAGTSFWSVELDLRWSPAGRIAPVVGLAGGPAWRTWWLGEEVLARTLVPALGAEAGLTWRPVEPVAVTIGVGGAWEAAATTVSFGGDAVAWTPLSAQLLLRVGGLFGGRGEKR